MRNLLAIMEAAGQVEIMVVVHPGSACGSAAFNLPTTGAAARSRLANDIAGWHGPVVVIDGSLSNELEQADCKELGRAVRSALAQAKTGQHLAIRVRGDDPGQMRAIRQVVAKYDLSPLTSRFSVTGAWVESRNPASGCVTSVVDTLREMGFTAEARSSALDIDSPEEWPDDA